MAVFPAAISAPRAPHTDVGFAGFPIPRIGECTVSTTRSCAQRVCMHPEDSMLAGMDADADGGFRAFMRNSVADLYGMLRVG